MKHPAAGALWVGMLLAGVVLASGCGRLAHRRAPGPNVLLVTIDTLRADHVGVYGDPDAATPTLDRLAAEGTRFETVVSPAPLTLPSHASLMTGLLPPHHGVRHNGIYRLDASFTTLAERFREAGYTTAAVVGSVVLAHGTGLDQGFDRYDDAIGGRQAWAAGFRERRAAEVTDHALAWLRDADRPFFLWVHYYDPHARYDPPSPFRERFADRLYDGEVAYADSELGRLIEALRSQRELDSTLVVVTADHGESLGEHGEETHSYTLYDATQRVPLIWRGPGIARGRRVAALASTVDIPVTLLAQLGLPPLTPSDGRDLAPLWRGQRRSVRGFAYAESLATRFDHGWSAVFALRTPEFLYIRAPRPELYRLEDDPDETKNLLAAAPEAWKAKAAAFDRELDDLLAQAREAPRIALDRRTRAQLQALGYALPEQPVPYTGMDPRDGLPWAQGFLRALAEFDRGNLEPAERFIDRMLKVLPESPSAHVLKARILLQRHRPREALEHAEWAARHVPRSAEYRVLVADARAQAGDREGALRAFRAAARLDPTRPEPEVGMAWILAVEGRIDEAERHARRAIELDPSNLHYRLRLADLWAHVGEHKRAYRAYREAAELDPTSREAHAGMWIELIWLGRDGEARRELERAGPAAARSPNLLNRVAIAYATRGEAKRAERLFRRILSEHPDYRLARLNLAHLLREQGREAEARSLEAQAGGQPPRGSPSGQGEPRSAARAGGAP